MLENYVDVIEASKILDIHPETVKRLIREGKIAATKFGNKWIMERDRLQVFANTYDGRRGRTKRPLCVKGIHRDTVRKYALAESPPLRKINGAARTPQPETGTPA